MPVVNENCVYTVFIKEACLEKYEGLSFCMQVVMYTNAVIGWEKITLIKKIPIMAQCVALCSSYFIQEVRHVGQEAEFFIAD